MLSVKPNPSRFVTVLFTLLFAASGLKLRAQEPTPVQVGDTRITGLPSDWSHRHVIFGDPGTEQNSISNGTHDQWNRVVNDPRYIFQQLRKGQSVRGPAAQEVETRQRIADSDRRRRDDWERRKRNHNKPPSPTEVTMHRDWSMNTGGSSSALTLTIPAASASVTTFTVNAGGTGAIAASSPTSSTGTVTVGTPYCFANGEGVKVNGVSLTTLATAPSERITIGTAPAQRDTITVGVSTNNPNFVPLFWSSEPEKPSSSPSVL